ncbi:hypothetical protein [Phytopseudomonas dryadis]|uniref:hypothetical protein n=1 Tax=Pseudomonadaceae TaxID=135621 RepID=UPI001F6027E7|nr:MULTISPECIES: hypothetical protein [Pseudomonas]
MRSNAACAETSTDPRWLRRFGYLEEHTGSIEGGLIGLAVVSLIAGILVFLTKTSKGADSGRGKPAKATPAVSPA